MNSAADSKVPWIYRVMEVNDKGEVIASGETYTVDGKTYRVAYSIDAQAGTTTATDPTKTGIELAFATADGKQPTVNMTVTNTYLEELNLIITKKGKNTTEELLSRVEFKLEKKDSTENWFEQAGSPQSTNEDGIATFEKLSQGTYRLIETKAAKDYNLLSDSVLIKIDASNQVQWKMEKESEDKWMTISPNEKNEIPLTIYNTKQLILPATGGSGFGWLLWVALR